MGSKGGAATAPKSTPENQSTETGVKEVVGSNGGPSSVATELESAAGAGEEASSREKCILNDRTGDGEEEKELIDKEPQEDGQENHSGSDEKEQVTTSLHSEAVPASADQNNNMNGGLVEEENTSAENPPQPANPGEDSEVGEVGEESGVGAGVEVEGGDQEAGAEADQEQAAVDSFSSSPTPTATEAQGEETGTGHKEE